MVSNNTISIIVCAYTENRWDDLIDAVSSLEAQTYQPKEIILSIDHNSALFDRAKTQFSRLVVVENSENRGLSGARNSGIAVANGEIIAFMDEDAVASHDWLSKIHSHFQNPNVMGVGGSIIPLWQTQKPDWFPEEFNWVVGCTYLGMPETPSPVRNLIGCNMAFRSEIFREVGGFRSEIGRIGTYPAGCEETELCIRAQQFYKTGIFLFDPGASVRHHVPASRTTHKYFLDRCYAEGISKALVSTMVGAQDGLASERTYTFKTLPHGFFKGIGESISQKSWAGISRAWAILSGLFFTTVGYLKGRLSLVWNKRFSATNRNLSLDQAT